MIEEGTDIKINHDRESAEDLHKNYALFCGLCLEIQGFEESKVYITLAQHYIVDDPANTNPHRDDDTKEIYRCHLQAISSKTDVQILTMMKEMYIQYIKDKHKAIREELTRRGKVLSREENIVLSSSEALELKSLQFFGKVKPNTLLSYDRFKSRYDKAYQRSKSSWEEAINDFLEV